jgi:hypothetical protein
MKRKTDTQDSNFFRAHRIHCINNKWYFLTREGENKGPFDSKEIAGKKLVEYLAIVRR